MFVIPVKRSKIAKSISFNGYRRIDESKYFYLQQIKNISLDSKKPRVRVITKGKVWYHEVAVGKDLYHIEDTWNYLRTLKVPSAIKTHAGVLTWIIAHITTLALPAVSEVNINKQTVDESLMPDSLIELTSNYANFLLERGAPEKPAPIRLRDKKIWSFLTLLLNLLFVLLRDCSFPVFIMVVISANFCLYQLTMRGLPCTMFVGFLLPDQEKGHTIMLKEQMQRRKEQKVLVDQLVSELARVHYKHSVQSKQLHQLSMSQREQLNLIAQTNTVDNNNTNTNTNASNEDKAMINDNIIIDDDGDEASLDDKYTSPHNSINSADDSTTKNAVFTGIGNSDLANVEEFMNEMDNVNNTNTNNMNDGSIRRPSYMNKLPPKH